MGNFISARQFKRNWTANSINLNSETVTQLLWVTDSWEQSCQPGRDTKFNSVQYPPPYILVHKSQRIWKESQGYYYLLEREMSVCLTKIPQQVLLQAVADNTAPTAQSYSAEEDFTFKSRVSNTEVWKFALHWNFWFELGSDKGA